MILMCITMVRNRGETRITLLSDIKFTICSMTIGEVRIIARVRIPLKIITLMRAIEVNIEGQERRGKRIH